ncbi:WXG100 family type VII secretion target [Glycomyces terrestris]|uniref:WXG100 family type VII secretion target n=1 Tax=Glycomyces terrestris TaxID=2493553 RepID=A0A426UY11_9ACTN|nr:hypothetical protein [Glycomyces terrestris]RRR99453.1 hypothetical protein EIW28_12150 [Glycomyces terrestris]
MSDQHGSDITQYGTPEAPGDFRRAVNSTPVVGSATSLAENIYGTIAGDDRLSSAAGIPADIAGIAMQGLLAVRDPIYALVNAGLGFLIELIDPLQELMDAVAGDKDEMARQGEVWGQVGDALGALSGETGDAVRANLTGWSGQAADAAYNQLTAIEAAIMAASQEALSVKTLLGWAQALSEAIEGCIRSIVAELLSWLVTRGLIALANSAWTFGASVATFILGAAAKGFSMFMRAMQWVQKSVKVFSRLATVMLKFLGKNPFRGINPTNGFELAGKGLWLGVLKNVGVKAGTGLLQGRGTAQATAKGAASNALSSAMYGSGGTTGAPVTVDLAELETTAGSFDGLATNAGAIQNVAQEASVAQMTWGLTGAFGFEEAYRDNTEGLAEAITAVESALGGSAIQLRGTAADYQASDDEAAAELNRILQGLER